MPNKVNKEPRKLKKYTQEELRKMPFEQWADLISNEMVVNLRRNTTEEKKKSNTNQ
jgi:hypothetical protein